MDTFRFTVDFDQSGTEKVEACKKAFPWVVDVPHRMVEHTNKFGTTEFECKMFDFPEGFSRKQVEHRIRSAKKANPWMPAEPVHMMAVATQHPEIMQQGQHKFVVGMGGDFPTVMGARFGGFGSGMTFFFTQVSHRVWKHAGGKDNRFMAVRVVQQ